MTGNYRALHEAIRSVAYSSRVCVAGFMQGEGAGLRLGEEFHHNRVSVDLLPDLRRRARRCSTAGTAYRLARTAIELAISGRLQLTELITHTVPIEQAPPRPFSCWTSIRSRPSRSCSSFDDTEEQHA